MGILGTCSYDFNVQREHFRGSLPINMFPNEPHGRHGISDASKPFRCGGSSVLLGRVILGPKPLTSFREEASTDE